MSSSEAPIVPTPVEKNYILQDVLKKRKQDINRLSMRVQRKEEKKSRRAKKNEKVHIPPEKFVEQYKRQQQAYNNFRKRDRKVERECLDLEVKDNRVIVVLRIRGSTDDISPEQSKILRSLRLGCVRSLVFVKVTKGIYEKLRRIENYITYGYPSKKMISELIFKHAYAKIGGEKKQIKNNKMVEDHLGDKGLICLEDLVNELAYNGENFEVVTKFLAPFKLTSPFKGFNWKHVNQPISKELPEGNGEWGNREEKINDLILNMI